MASNTDAETLLSSLKKASLIATGNPSVIPDDFKPTTDLKVSFGSKAVSHGNLLRVSDVKNVPTVSFNAEVQLNFPLR